MIPRFPRFRLFAQTLIVCWFLGQQHYTFLRKSCKGSHLVVCITAHRHRSRSLQDGEDKADSSTRFRASCRGQSQDLCSRVQSEAAVEGPRQQGQQQSGQHQPSHPRCVWCAPGGAHAEIRQTLYFWKQLSYVELYCGLSAFIMLVGPLSSFTATVSI